MHDTREERISMVGKGRFPGVRTYNTGPYSSELVNRDDVMRMMLAEKALHFLLDEDDVVTIEVSDYQSEDEDHTLHVYVNFDGIQADADIRSDLPEQIAIWLYEQIEKELEDRRTRLQRIARHSRLYDRVTWMGGGKTPSPGLSVYDGHPTRYVGLLASGATYSNTSTSRVFTLVYGETIEHIESGFRSANKSWKAQTLIDLDDQEAFHVRPHMAFELVPFGAKLDLLSLIDLTADHARNSA